MTFTRQLAAMVGAGLPLFPALRSIRKDLPKRSRLKAVLGDVVGRVELGVDLATALEQHKAVFDRIYVSVVRSGLESARLDQALEDLAVYLKGQDEIHRRVMQALVYPGFVFMVFVGVFWFMTNSIIPEFANLYGQMGKALPDSTQRLLAVSRFLSMHASELSALGLALLLVARQVIRQHATRRHIDRWLIRFVPVFGEILRLRALARFLRTFAVQAQNGVPLHRALMVSSSSVGNAHIEGLLLGIVQEVEIGISLSESFGRRKLFDGIVTQMISSGEEAGSLDRLLLTSADYFDSLTRESIDTAINLINPILMLILGMFVAAVIIGSYEPILKLGTIYQ
jgi:type II secretory pathway component PulF